MENVSEKAKADRSNRVIQVEMLGSGCGDREKNRFKGYLRGKMDRICRGKEVSRMTCRFLTYLAG